MNNYIVRSYRDVIVVTKIATRRTSKELSIVLYYSIREGGPFMMLYSKKDTGENPRIELCGTALQWVDMVKHLGNYLDTNMKDETEIRRKKGDLIQG